MADSDDTTITKSFDTIPRPKLNSPMFSESAPYKLRYDALMITCATLGATPNPSMDMINALLMGTQQRLIEAIIFDETVEQEVKNQLLKFQSKTVAHRLSERRGARLRVAA